MQRPANASYADARVNFPSPVSFLPPLEQQGVKIRHAERVEREIRSLGAQLTGLSFAHHFRDLWIVPGVEERNDRLG